MAVVTMAILIAGSEMIQRIDADTEDVVDNVQGAQRELMKYWSRVSGNRWLVAKMFGVLMVGSNVQSSKLILTRLQDILPPLGSHFRLDKIVPFEVA